MKKIIIAIIFVFSCNSFAQDTSIVKFLPLKVGNVWVYNTTYNKKARISITNTINANGHVYYVFGMTGDSCHCAQGPSTPFLSGLLPMRIDSLTGNIMFYNTSSCAWHTNETLLDSLKTSPGQGSNNICNETYCFDTAAQSVFGTLRNTISVGLNIMTYGTSRRYAKGMGLVRSTRGCFFSTCEFTLLGSVIDGVVYGDTNMIVGISQISSEIPASFSLSQNYPNPFNPSTKIKFDVPLSKGGERGLFVRLTIYDERGREIETLINEKLYPGTYETNWDASNFPSGAYYYQLTVSNEQLSNFKETKKMVLIK